MAARDVKLGELLGVETPALSFLHQDSGLACTHCFAVCPAPLPSPFSSKSVFCSRSAQIEEFFLRMRMTIKSQEMS